MQTCVLLQTNSAVGPLRADTLNQRLVMHTNRQRQRLASCGQFVAGIYRCLRRDGFGSRLDLSINLIDGHLDTISFCLGADRKSFPRTLDFHIRFRTLGSRRPMGSYVAYRSVLQSDTVYQIGRRGVRLRDEGTDSLDDSGDMRLGDVVPELSEGLADHLVECLRNHRCVSISGVGFQRKPSFREIDVVRVDVESDGVPSQVLGSNRRRARAHEGVHDDACRTHESEAVLY